MFVGNVNVHGEHAWNLEDVEFPCIPLAHKNMDNSGSEVFAST